MDILKAHGKKILLLVAAFGLAALTLAIWLNDIPDRDSVHRYIPMTEAFVHGDYAFAFHPRIPPLHQICGGIVSKLLGVNVFLGLRITSAIWHFIGAALLCRLLFVLYPARRMVAVAGTALYMFFPYMFHLAYSGLRETAKCALLILLALGLVHICRERTRWRWYLLLGGAAGLGALCRAEMTAIGLFCLFMAAVMESESGKFPLRSAAGTVVALAFGFGNSLVNHHFFGHAMSDIRFARLFMDLTGRNAQPLDALVLAAAIMILLTAGAYWAERLLRRIPAGYQWGAVMLVALAVAVFTAFTGRRHGNPSEIGAFVI
ncbi:MAG: glycosyltransferase family 39 protein, partial [Lentisphaeria bacterium]|nr:glycosyltransferase family 39 protein [Lentisphaeria bacterium]